MRYRKTETRVHWYAWRIGEVYYREQGDSPFTLVSIEYVDRRDRCHYTRTHNNSTKVSDCTEYLVLAETLETEEEEKEMTNKLYQVIGTEQCGNFLAVNSEGKTVLEMKPNGELKSFTKTQIEEVLPWTFEVHVQQGEIGYHYQGDKDSVEVGDILIINNDTSGLKLVTVTAVNTKSKKATKRFTGLKLQGDKLT